MSDWPPSPLLWPALLSGALLCGIVASVACLKFRERLAVNVGIDLAALAEAAIAICSGALLWIGFWDFIDSYLVPTAWWSKLCMLLVGALGALWTRSLYADQMPPRHAISSAEGTSVCVEDGELDLPPARRDGPPPLVEAISPRPRSFGQSEDDFDVETAIHHTPGLTPARAVMQSARKGTRGAATGRRGGRRIGAHDEETTCGRYCFLNPPRFSCSRCSRALLATFSGLTMWVGLWDLIESHMLPTLFTSCAHEPSTGCALVKLSLVGVGAFGLYLTRSLYGDHGVGAVQFQRL